MESACGGWLSNKMLCAGQAFDLTASAGRDIMRLDYINF